ncbi:hypothetical protein [Apilactobacillus xinyiensis]|uniref:YtxH domain-containing protein n=1 Tax=Apilactobacillus xinyiensis TaxID=2841032 RepID=A0ABT0I1Q7_9LACO|nr:hypothetical protein [Apilactobacillus xinyiensis]MCK8624660.1 hypothetical protein [Apilactobacillus xinyiensis]MCL0329983.1 hypothetical protein [Apilactobacillus xinyiensis]
MGKSGFLLGFVSGVAATAYAAYQKMNDDQKQNLVNNTKQMVNDVKSRAVDYTFYARDSFDDLKDKVSDKTDEVKDTLYSAADKATDKVDDYADNKTTQFHQAADNLRNDLKDDNEKEEDIVIDGGFIHQNAENK